MIESARTAVAPAPGGELARLRTASRQVEGSFLQQMFQAMRQTVPEGGIADGGAGEEMFTGVMDQHLADSAAGRSTRGPGEALYRQLSAVYARLHAPAATAEGATTHPAPREAP